MTFRSVRDKVRWVALIGALGLFAMDMYCRKYCYEIIISDTAHGPVPFKEPNRSYLFMIVWLPLLGITLLSGLITLPRWQSFVALVAVGVVTLLWLYS